MILNTLEEWCKANNREDLLAEWHPTKNGELSPDNVSCGSSKKVWWIYPYDDSNTGKHFDFEWQATISNRVGRGSGCPYISKISRATWKGFNDLETFYPELAKQWHPTKNGTLTPSEITRFSSKKVWWLCDNGHEWNTTVANRTCSGSGCPYCAGKVALKGFNDLATIRPDIAKEWHPTKNGELKPTDVLPGTDVKVWWRCSQGHEWQALIYCRTGKAKHGCPYCAGKRVLEGFNDLSTTNPDIAKEWHPSKNAGLKPTDVTSGSAKKVWWQCSQGHEWQTTIGSRTGKAKHGCPYCAGKRVLEGFNDLSTTNPDIAKEWHPTRNGNLTPDSVTHASAKIVWWQCSECGHEWQTAVGNRTCNGSGCPMCMKKKNPELNIQSRLKKGRSLADNYPDVAKEWHPIKNGKIKASDVTCASTKKVWWICSKGHEWQADVGSRTLHNSGCPYCSGHSVLSGFNDLASVRPDIAKEWHPTKNGKLTPSDVTVGSGKIVWWRCQYGHEWRAEIKGRISHNNNCPKCLGSGTSLAEQGVAFYLEQVSKVEQRIKLNGQEIDVYLPEYRIGVEYDGQFYHTDEKKNKEIYKNKKIADIGIVLIRIKESDNNFIEDNIIYFKEDNLGNNYAWALNQLCQMLITLTGNLQFGVLRIDIEGDIVKIRQRVNFYHKERSLLALNPRIAKEWHPEKNGILTPEMFYEKSSVKVWWKCSLGHEWQANISSRTFRGGGCPFCAGKRVLKGYNDLLTVNPELAKEWNSDKNGQLTPEDVTCGSNKIVWWKCSLGHEWQASICDRKNTQCPYCAGKRTLEGFNDLRTVRPEIAREWHQTKNGTLTPEMFSIGSTTKIWWHCLECGNDWYVSINSRTNLNTGCPECGKKKSAVSRRKTLVMKYGSLAEKCPDIASEWHPTKNGELKPTDVTCGSKEKVWWKCPEGHEWQAAVQNRTGNNKTGCPYCSKKRKLS